MKQSTFILIGGAVVLVALSAATIVMYVKQVNPAAVRGKLANAERRFKCSQCGAEFPCEFVPVDANVTDQEIASRPDCPSCKASHSGMLMQPCLQCGKYFASPAADPNGVPIKTICSFCKTDQDQWYQAHVKDSQ